MVKSRASSAPASIPLTTLRTVATILQGPGKPRKAKRRAKRRAPANRTGASIPMAAGPMPYPPRPVTQTPFDPPPFGHGHTLHTEALRLQNLALEQNIRSNALALVPQERIAAAEMANPLANRSLVSFVPRRPPATPARTVIPPVGGGEVLTRHFDGPVRSEAPPEPVVPTLSPTQASGFPRRAIPPTPSAGSVFLPDSSSASSGSSSASGSSPDSANRTRVLPSDPGNLLDTEMGAWDYVDALLPGAGVSRVRRAPLPASDDETGAPTRPPPLRVVTRDLSDVALRWYVNRLRRDPAHRGPVATRRDKRADLELELRRAPVVFREFSADAPIA